MENPIVVHIVKMLYQLDTAAIRAVYMVVKVIYDLTLKKE